MNVVYSSAWLEFFADGPNAGEFAMPLADRTMLVVSTISIYEVFMVVYRQRGENATLQAWALPLKAFHSRPARHTKPGRSCHMSYPKQTIISFFPLSRNFLQRANDR